MEIIVCPKCKMRVVPKPDGTCPSCLSNTVKGKTSITDHESSKQKRKSRTYHQNLTLLKWTGSIWIFQLLSIFLDLSSTDFTRLGWPVIIGLSLAAFLTPVFLFLGFRVRRAYIAYILLSLLVCTCIFSLLGSGFQPISGNLSLIYLVLGLCVFIFIGAYRSSLHKLVGGYAERTGMLNAKKMYCNLAKNLYSNKEQEFWGTLAMILIPLSAGLGAILNRVFPDQIQLFMSMSALMIGCALIPAPSSHLAIAKYLRSTEIKLGKVIKI